MTRLLAAAAVGVLAGTTALAASDWTLYRASIAAADGALRLHEASAAATWLETAPAAERGWEWHYLHALADESRRSISAHQGAITGVTVSADGTVVATTSADRAVGVFDAATGARRTTLTGAAGTTWSPALRSTHPHVAAMSSDGTLRVWDYSVATAATPIAAFERIGRGLGGTAWSPDGTLLAAATWTVEPGAGVKGWVHLWRFDDRQLLWKAQYGVKPIPTIAFRADGRQLAAGTWDGWIGLFDVAGTGTVGPDIRIAPVDGRYTAVQSVAYDRSGDVIVGAKDGFVRTFTSATGEAKATYSGHARWVNAAVPGPADGGWMASASSDETIRVWDVTRARPTRVLHGHRAGLAGLAVAPKGDLVSGDADGTLRWWDVARANLDRNVWRLADASFYGIDFSRDGRRAVTASWGGIVAMRSVPDGRVLWSSDAHKGSANTVSLSPDGTRVVSSGNDGQLVVLDVEGRRLRAWDPGVGRQITSVAWSPDGRHVFSPSAAPGGTLWDAETGQAIRTIAGRGGSMTAVAFSPDGTLIGIGSTNGDVTVARVDTGETTVVQGAHPGGVHALAFSPRGETLATGGADRTVRLWTVAGLTPVRSLRGHAETITGVTFSPDGRRLASSSNDQTVRLWAPATGEQLIAIPFDDQVYGVRFAPGGTVLAALPLDGTVRLLEAPSYH